MEILSPYLLTAAIAWLVAQGLKYLHLSLKLHSFRNLRQLYLSGNMPSAHSATSVALLVFIGCKDGTQSAIFGLAALFTAVVMYDAVMVRRSSGEQGKAILAMLKEQQSTIAKPRVAKGHTPIEVVVGAVVGAIVGFVVFLATM
jgi:acid phosphatase family membrane protein YuiD